jgi:hypothetical protein
MIRQDPCWEQPSYDDREEEIMRLMKHPVRFGMIVGFGAGYVLGTKAGRERYTQIVNGWRSLRRSELFQTATAKATDGLRAVGEQVPIVRQRRMEPAPGSSYDSTLANAPV